MQEEHIDQIIESGAKTILLHSEAIAVQRDEPRFIGGHLQQAAGQNLARFVHSDGKHDAADHIAEAVLLDIDGHACLQWEAHRYPCRQASCEAARTDICPKDIYKDYPGTYPGSSARHPYRHPQD